MRRVLMVLVAAGLSWPAAAHAQSYVVPVCSTATGPHPMSGTRPRPRAW
jgi:hypothetical protein